ncbi:hypothetical protein Nmel_005058 [Mimus melanotis]
MPAGLWSWPGAPTAVGEPTAEPATKAAKSDFSRVSTKIMAQLHEGECTITDEKWVNVASAAGGKVMELLSAVGFCLLPGGNDVGSWLFSDGDSGGLCCSAGEMSVGSYSWC